MNYFLNYSVDAGLSIKTSRDPSATAGDIRDLVAAYQSKDESVVCDLDGALGALEDGSLWQDSDQEAIEDVHAFISEWERDEQ